MYTYVRGYTYMYLYAAVVAFAQTCSVVGSIADFCQFQEFDRTQRLKNLIELKERWFQNLTMREIRMNCTYASQG